jgi:hypothetical protein
VRNFLAERGMDGPTRTIALKIGLPLLDHATLEEENELQDLWATLLVNGGDGDRGIELRRAFVSVLDEMTALDARNLTVIERASPFTLDGSTTGVWVSKLPHLAVPASRRDAEVVNASPTLEILTSISNLERLGCVGMPDGIAPPRAVCLTLFGRAFVQACTFQRTP